MDVFACTLDLSSLQGARIVIAIYFVSVHHPIDYVMRYQSWGTEEGLIDTHSMFCILVMYR